MKLRDLKSKAIAFYNKYVVPRILENPDFVTLLIMFLSVVILIAWLY